MSDDAKETYQYRALPPLYKDLWEWYHYSEIDGTIIEVLVEADTGDGERGFTYTEIRDLLEAHFDKAYDPEDRHLECKPTQREVNFAIEVMLSATDWNNLVLRERDGLVYMIGEAEREAIDDVNHEAGYKLDRAQVG